MKKNKIIIICLMVILLIIPIVSLLFLDEIIPIHIGINGQPDQFGSKYFIFLFSGIGIVIALIMILVSNHPKLSLNYKKYLLSTCVLIEILFIVFSIAFVMYAVSYVNDEEVFDISKIIMLAIGTLFILMGNFTPKIEKNKTLGVKTKWSLYNEVTWQKTHRLTGFVFVIIGVIIIVSGILFHELVNYIVLSLMLVLLTIIVVIGSYIYYKQEITK